MKKILLLFAFAALLLTGITSCTQEGDYVVRPAGWKGIDFVVRDTVTKVQTHYIDTVWNTEHTSFDLKANTSIVPKPGNQLRVYAIRATEDLNCGAFKSPSSMTLYMTGTYEDGNTYVDSIPEVEVICTWYDLNHFYDPYATFKLPTEKDGKKIAEYKTIDVYVYLVFNAYGKYLDPNWRTVSKHVNPYLGEMQTTSLTILGGQTISQPLSAYHYTPNSIQLYRKN